MPRSLSLSMILSRYSRKSTGVPRHVSKCLQDSNGNRSAVPLTLISWRLNAASFYNLFFQVRISTKTTTNQCGQTVPTLFRAQSRRIACNFSRVLGPEYNGSSNIWTKEILTFFFLLFFSHMELLELWALNQTYPQNPKYRAYLAENQFY